jgi:uncharacterized membrane protein
MTESQYELVLAVFEDEETAATVYKDLHQAEKDHKVDLENVALVHKKADGKIELKEEAEKLAGEAGIGALVGGALGILAGPMGVVAFGAMGAALGGIAAKLDDVGFDDSGLNNLGEDLQPGESAIVAVLDSEFNEKLVSEFKSNGARVAVEQLPDDFKQILEDDDKFAYRIASDEVQEAAHELGLVDSETKDYVADEPRDDPFSEDDPDAAIPRF